jgi:hypothetical protein
MRWHATRIKPGVKKNTARSNFSRAISGCAAAGCTPRKNDALPDKTMRCDPGVVFDSAKAGGTRKLLAWALEVGFAEKRDGAPDA